MLVTFIEADGKEQTVSATAGMNARDVAVNNSIPGIDGDCGGACACATCHVHVDPAWIDRTGVVVEGSQEAELLQFADEVLPTSRLACQIKLSDGLDGLVLRIPASQH